MNLTERYYAPNGVIYQNGEAIGFYDTADTLGMISEQEEAELRQYLEDAKRLAPKTLSREDALAILRGEMK